MQNATEALIRPAKHVAGTLHLPGDKSISHRYAMLAAIAEGSTLIENFSTGADCASTVRCVESLGAKVKRSGSMIEIEGCGLALHPTAHPLDCGNSGSTMRMLSGILAGQRFESELFGDESLSRRPMRRVMEPLRAMGAHLEATDGHAPLRIRGAQLRSVDYRMPVASAQVKSAVLFAGLYAQGATSVEEPLRTRDHTELALRAFGAEVSRSRNRVTVSPAAGLHALQAVVPGDISTAAFFLCAAAILPGSELLFDNLLLNPSRAALLDVLVALGLEVSMLQVEDRNGELAGNVHVRHRELRGLEISGATSAALIDELPVLAAIGPYTKTGIDIRDAGELRVKESDRIACVAANLRAMGAEVEEREDGLRVPGAQRLHGAELQSFGDHRIAMAFSIAALGAEGESTIRGADAARISFPEFFDALRAIGQD